MGEKMARWPRRKAVARVSSRAITAWSAAFSAGCGAMVTSYGRGPYSGRKESGLFRQKGVRLEPRGAERGDDAFAKLALSPAGAEAVSMARTLLHPRIDELLLEGGDEVQPACG